MNETIRLSLRTLKWCTTRWSLRLFWNAYSMDIRFDDRSGWNWKGYVSVPVISVQLSAKYKTLLVATTVLNMYSTYLLASNHPFNAWKQNCGDCATINVCLYIWDVTLLTRLYVNNLKSYIYFSWKLRRHIQLRYSAS